MWHSSLSPLSVAVTILYTISFSVEFSVLHACATASSNILLLWETFGKEVRIWAFYQRSIKLYGIRSGNQNQNENWKKDNKIIGQKQGP